jgi:L-aspartate oxidase
VAQSDIRRYLINIDSISTRQFFTGVLVVGSGIAGLRAAIEAAQHHKVTLVCKDSVTKSNTWAAQGGIAAVMDPEDDLESHIDDTIKTGCGIADRKVIDLVVSRCPKLVRQLYDWGTGFDLDGGKLATTLEGGHSRSRVVHANGDSTGKAIAQTLIDKAMSHPNIKIIEDFYAIDLLSNEDNRCMGIIGYHHGDTEIIWAGATILATGGAGRLYRETTNPSIATADGLAMAYRLGATLRDMEFMQFHPTTLYIAGASRALITEALRGEGGILVDGSGYAFMKDYDSNAELAPRDIVSRAIVSHLQKTHSTHVFLDVRHFEKGFFEKRFPYIYSLCRSFDINPETDLIPVRPSAHYMIGGVKTDLDARTSVPGLYACGEAASTGLHGANRLASNSLAEGLVFGEIAGRCAAEEIDAEPAFKKIKYTVNPSDRSLLDTSDVRNSLRAVMWRNVGINRKEQLLRETQEIIGFWQRYVMDKIFDKPEGWECQNMLTVSRLIAKAAQMRKESRGVHYRDDYPQRDDANFQNHIELTTNF